jgi:hypothetical protein
MYVYSQNAIYIQLQNNALSGLLNRSVKKLRIYLAEPNFGILRDIAVFLVPH